MGLFKWNHIGVNSVNYNQVSLVRHHPSQQALMDPTMGFMGLLGMGLTFKNQRGLHVGKALGIEESATA